MAELNISPKFDLDDIRKIREHNSKRHKAMTASELHSELSKSTELFLSRMKNIDKTSSPN